MLNAHMVGATSLAAIINHVVQTSAPLDRLHCLTKVCHTVDHDPADTCFTGSGYTKPSGGME
jgi:hypothetical protein